MKERIYTYKNDQIDGYLDEGKSVNFDLLSKGKVIDTLSENNTTLVNFEQPFLEFYGVIYADNILHADTLLKKYIAGKRPKIEMKTHPNNRFFISAYDLKKGMDVQLILKDGRHAKGLINEVNTNGYDAVSFDTGETFHIQEIQNCEIQTKDSETWYMESLQTINQIKLRLKSYKHGEREGLEEPFFQKLLSIIFHESPFENLSSIKEDVSSLIKDLDFRRFIGRKINSFEDVDNDLFQEILNFIESEEVKDNAWHINKSELEAGYHIKFDYEGEKQSGKIKAIDSKSIQINGSTFPLNKINNTVHLYSGFDKWFFDNKKLCDKILNLVMRYGILLSPFDNLSRNKVILDFMYLFKNKANIIDNIESFEKKIINLTLECFYRYPNPDIPNRKEILNTDNLFHLAKHLEKMQELKINRFLSDKKVYSPNSIEDIDFREGMKLVLYVDGNEVALSEITKVTGSTLSLSGQSSIHLNWQLEVDRNEIGTSSQNKAMILLYGV